MNFCQYQDNIQMPDEELPDEVKGRLFGTVVKVKVLGGHFVSKSVRMKNLEVSSLKSKLQQKMP